MTHYYEDDDPYEKIQRLEREIIELKKQIEIYKAKPLYIVQRVIDTISTGISQEYTTMYYNPFEKHPDYIGT